MQGQTFDPWVLIPFKWGNPKQEHMLSDWFFNYDSMLVYTESTTRESTARLMDEFGDKLLARWDQIVKDSTKGNLKMPFGNPYNVPKP